MKPDFRTGDQDSEDEYLLTHAPTLKIVSRPEIIQNISGKVRLEVLWRQVGTEGPNTQIMNGRTDLIFIRENGKWRLNDAITNTTPDETQYTIPEFEKTIGVMHLNHADAASK